MFQHQDVLYRNGPLALVWLIGSGGLQKSKGKKSKLIMSILKASIAQLCDKITEVMKIPRPLGSGSESWSQDHVLDMKTISILVLGLSTMQREQIIHFKKEVDALYESCRWRMPIFVGSQAAIDLPIERHVIQDVSLNITQQQEEFGEMFINEEFVYEGIPRTLHPLERNEEAAVSEDNMDLTTVNVMDLLKKNKAEQKRAAKRARTSKLQDKDNDDGILRILRNTLAKADSAAVTMPEIDLPRLDASHIEGEAEGNFFGDDNIIIMDTTIGKPPPITPDDNPMDIDLLPTDSMNDQINLELTSRNQTTPTESNSLTRMIQQNTPQSPEGYVTGPPRNKRRRTSWRRADEVTEFSSAELRKNVYATQCLPDEDRIRLIIESRALIPPSNHVMPTRLRRNAQVLESIEQFWGRRLEKNLSDMLVVGMQNRLLNLSTEERRREGSAAAAPNVSNALPIAQGDASTTNPICQNPTSPDPQRDQLPMSPAREAQENQLDLELLPAMEPSEVTSDVTLAEEHRTPQRPHLALEEPGEVAGSSVGEIQMPSSNGRYFHELLPPAATTKVKAALEFQRLLKLQATKKVVLEQERFCGPIKIIELCSPLVV